MFSRGGSYIDHIETDNCSIIRKEAFDKLRDASDEYYKSNGKKLTPGTIVTIDGEVSPTEQSAVESGMSLLDLPCSTGSAEFDKMFPPLLIKKPNCDDINIGNGSIPNGGVLPGRNRQEAILPDLPSRSPANLNVVGSDLESVNASSTLLVRPLNLTPSKLARAETEPGTSGILGPSRNGRPERRQLSIQGNQSNLKESDLRYYHRYDPDQPGFNLEQYKNLISKKYNCPYPGCS